MSWPDFCGLVCVSSVPLTESLYLGLLCPGLARLLLSNPGRGAGFATGRLIYGMKWCSQPPHTVSIVEALREDLPVLDWGLLV